MAAAVVSRARQKSPCATGDHSCCWSCCQALPWHRDGCAVLCPSVIKGALPSFASCKRILPEALWIGQKMGSSKVPWLCYFTSARA